MLAAMCAGQVPSGPNYWEGLRLASALQPLAVLSASAAAFTPFMRAFARGTSATLLQPLLTSCIDTSV